MATDVLILNNAVTDLRRPDFEFVDGLAGPGGLARFRADRMPGYSQGRIRKWIEQGFATAGGGGNSAPLKDRYSLIGGYDRMLTAVRDRIGPVSG